MGASGSTWIATHGCHDFLPIATHATAAAHAPWMDLDRRRAATTKGPATTQSLTVAWDTTAITNLGHANNVTLRADWPSIAGRSLDCASAAAVRSQ